MKKTQRKHKNAFQTAIAFFAALALIAAPPPPHMPQARVHAFSADDFEYSDSPYYIYVEKGSFTLTVYGKDADGRHTVPLGTFPTAIGRSRLMTPTGVFYKGRAEDWHSWGTSYSPFASEYYPGLYVHGPLYRSTSFGQLIESSVTQIGQAASSGCLRTTAIAAYFVYKYCPDGTPIHIVEGSPIGFFADPADIDGQKGDPADMPLSDIFPGHGELFVGDSYSPISPQSTGYPHSAPQKSQASDNVKISLSKKSIVLYADPGGANDGARRTNENSERLDAVAVAYPHDDSNGHSFDDAMQAPPLNAAAFPPADADSVNWRRANPVLVDEPVMWISGDSGVAAVAYDGTVSAVAPGNTYIYALSTDGTRSGKCAVTVLPEPEPNYNNALSEPEPNTVLPEPAPRGKMEKQVFSDVAPGHWAYDAVVSLVSEGVVEGGGESYFYPDDDITKAEFIKLLMSASPKGRYILYLQSDRAKPENNGGGAVKNSGNDIPKETDGINPYGAAPDWFAPYYAAALEAGVANPDGPPPEVLAGEYLTREDMARYIVLAGRYAPSGTAVCFTDFTDAGDIVDSGYVFEAVRRGCMSAYSDAGFRPRGYVTRAEAAVCVYKTKTGAPGERKP